MNISIVIYLFYYNHIFVIYKKNILHTGNKKYHKSTGNYIQNVLGIGNFPGKIILHLRNNEDIDLEHVNFLALETEDKLNKNLIAGFIENYFFICSILMIIEDYSVKIRTVFNNYSCELFKRFY